MAIPVPFVSVQRVYFDDLDALNILHNMRYLLFIERARGALFNAMGFHWQDDLEKNPDKFHVVAEHGIRYLKPVRGEGDLGIVLRISLIGRTSLAILGPSLTVLAVLVVGTELILTRLAPIRPNASS